MKFLEKNLEDIIFETDNKKLFERGLPIFGKKLRQVNLGSYGIADLICFERSKDQIIVTVIELKKDCVNLDALIQALRYVEGIKNYFRLRKFYKKSNIKYVIRLCGSKISNQKEIALITSNISDDFLLIDSHKYEYDVDGLRFTEFDYDYGILDERTVNVFSSKRKKKVDEVESYFESSNIPF